MRILISCSLLLVLSACFTAPPKYWQHKTVPSAQWNSDHNKCKRAVDRHLGLTSAYEADQGLDQYSEQMRRYEVGKKQKKLVATCMRKAGYVPIR